jgi:Beta protein
MNQQLKYVPVFRVRQQEWSVLKEFDFGKNIYPFLEIIKELPRKQPAAAAKKSSKNKAHKFELEYLPLIGKINAQKVFVDLPVHLKPDKKMPNEIIDFLSRISGDHNTKVTYYNKLLPYAPKIIPVISSYMDITGKTGSVANQEKGLRKNFPKLAFRCFSLGTLRDLIEIKKVIKPEDYLFIDWEEIDIDLVNNYEHQDIVAELKTFTCTVIIHRNPIPFGITNTGLIPETVIKSIDNSLLKNFREYGGVCVSDFAGIKKDLSEGGRISPGFIYYDAVDNDFYGFRYKYGGHSKDEISPELEEFETTIIPAIMSCEATERMQMDALDYLGGDNPGWQTIQNIARGTDNGGESGQNAGKFKKIGMEHYIHCIKTKIDAGYFN